MNSKGACGAGTKGTIIPCFLFLPFLLLGCLISSLGFFETSLGSSGLIYAAGLLLFRLLTLASSNLIYLACSLHLSWALPRSSNLSLLSLFASLRSLSSLAASLYSTETLATAFFSFRFSLLRVSYFAFMALMSCSCF